MRNYRLLLSIAAAFLLPAASAKKYINGIFINPWGDPDLDQAELDNVQAQYWLGWIWVGLFAAFLTYHVAGICTRHIRKLICLNNQHQKYFMTPVDIYNTFQRHLLDAPLFHNRHRREFRLSSAINMGVLPTRFQILLLLAYFGVNTALSVVNINWGSPEVLWAAEFRDRTGVLATMNMIPLFLFAGRNNPLIKLLGISFDTYNMMHRWLGRTVVILSLAHGISQMIWQEHNFGWPTFIDAVKTDPMTQTGLGTMAAFLVLVLQASSAVRHAFYETFLTIHFLVAGTAVAALWIHLEGLAYLYMLYGGIGIWIFERTCRFLRLIYRNCGRKFTKAELEALPGDAIRVTIKMARPWTFHPGQYVFLYVPAIGWWTSHPFSLAWSQEQEDLSQEKGMPMQRQDILVQHKTEMSLIVRRRTGFTDSLYQRAAAAKGNKATVTALIEGPYGGQSLESYGTVVLFAAGVGITHQLSHLRALIAGHANRTTATRRVALVWIIQSPEHLDWIRGWMTNILAMEKRRDVLRILLFVTRPRSNKEIHSPSASVQMYPGRPNVAALIDAEAEAAQGAMCVSVCGTGSLSDEVRAATRRWQSRRNVDFVENAFTW